MATKQLEVRKVNPARVVYFDDQLWPVLTSLWLLAAGIQGSIVWFGLDSWRQGQLWPVVAAIGALGTSLAVSIVLGCTSPRRLRRGMALALFLSLLLNLATACGLAYVRLPIPIVRVDEDDPPQDQVDEITLTYPEFFEMAEEGDDRPTHDISKPVSTGEANRDERDLVQKTTIRNPELERRLANAAPAIENRPTPVTIARREFREAAPRHSEFHATLSRQMLEAKPVVGTPVPQTPEQTPTLPATQPASLAVARTAERDANSLVKPPSADERLRADPHELPAALLTARSNSRAAQREDAVPFSAVADDVPRKRRSLQPPAELRTSIPRQPNSQAASELIARASIATPQRNSLSPDASKTAMPELTDDLVRNDPLGLMRSERVTAQPRNTSLRVELTERRPLSATRPTPQLVDVDAEQRIAPETEDPAETALPQPNRQRLASVEHPLTMPAPRHDAVEPRPLMARLGTRAAPADVPAASEIAADLDSTMETISGETSPSLASPHNEAATGQAARRRMLSQPPAPNRSTAPRPASVARSEPSQQRNPQPAKTTLDDAETARRGQSRPEVETLTMPGEGEPQSGLPSALADSGIQRAGGMQPPTISRSSASVAMPTRRAIVVNAPSVPTDVQAEQVQLPRTGAAPPSIAAASRGIGRNEQPLVSAGPLPEPDQSITGPPLAELHARPRVARASVVADVEPASDEASGVPRRSPTAGAPRPFAADVDVPLVRLQVAAQVLEPSPGPQAVDAQVRSGPAVEAEFIRPPLEVQALEGPTAIQVAQLKRQTQPLDALPRVSVAGESEEESAENDSPADGDEARAAPTRKLASVAMPIANRVGIPTEATMQRDNDPTTALDRAGLVATAADAIVIAKSSADQVGAAGGLKVDVEVRDGLGGLASDISRDLGSLTRQAVPDSTEIVDSVGRFRRRDPGGLLAALSRDVTAASAFQTRLNRQGDQPFGGNGRPSPQTEEAIELGLFYLASLQQDEGSWSFRLTGEQEHLPADQRTNPSLQSDTAATGLSLLSFLGAGYHHRSEKYGAEVRAGLNYLIARQQQNGDLYQPMDSLSNKSAQLYSHGIAAIALCEAYGMTQDPDIREPAQRAIDFLVDAQHPELGGWRYTPQYGSDTSVSGWMVMAMRSGELASLKVDPQAWDNVVNWLDVARASTDQPHLFRYNPYALENASQGHGRLPSKTMTSVGLLMRMYTGWRREDPRLIAGGKYLQANLPAIGTWDNPQRDTYYWYYATQVMFHMGGDYWEAWHESLHPMLTSSQVQIGPLAGSWDPRAPIPDRWAPHAGRLYVTTMNLLSLEVFYRHLPIYEDTAYEDTAR